MPTDADLDYQGSNQNRPYAQAYNMPNGAPGVPAVPPPGAAQLLPNQGRVLQQGAVRVLCIADVRGMFVTVSLQSYFLLSSSNISTGNLRSLNDLARDAKANYIIHTGDFGFYDNTSLDRIAEKYCCPPYLTHNS
jgi:hypothetical protein